MILCIQKQRLNLPKQMVYKTILQEFYQIALKKHIYNDINALQKELDEWLFYYNNERTHHGNFA